MVSVFLKKVLWGALIVVFSNDFFSQNLQQFESRSELAASQWGFVLMNIESGEVIAQREASRMLSTASIMKAVTATTALAQFGPDYTFTTTLGHTGSLVEDRITGNLVIQGSGDPSLGSERFPDAAFLANWAESLKAKGIASIEGGIIADVTVYGTQLTPDDWPWQDMGNYYGAGASALNFQENMYSLHLNAGSYVGDKVKLVRSYPDMPEIEFVNELKTGSRGSGDQAYIFGSPYTSKRYLRGTIPLGARAFKIKGSVSNPALRCAEAFREALQSCGIEVAGASKVEYQQSPQTRLLDKKISPSANELISEMNMHSINLYAESLLRKAAKKRDPDDAAKWLNRYWKGKGITDAMHFTDGSGLSGSNAASPMAIARILTYAAKQPWFPQLKASLPVGGQSGSLKRRFRGTAGEGRVFAKTGTTGNVRSLAGYIDSKSGKRYAFCFMVNHFNVSGGKISRIFDSWLASIAGG